MKIREISRARPDLRRIVKSALPSKRAIARSLITAVVSASVDIGRLAGDR